MTQIKQTGPKSPHLAPLPGIRPWQPLLAVLLLSLPIQALPAAGGEKPVLTLKDFTRDEVKGIGFTLERDTKVHIVASGCGERSLAKLIFDGPDSRSTPMKAFGWIIDANTRQMCWEMTADNSPGITTDRQCDETITLPRGEYELYFCAHGFVSDGVLHKWSGNIDRRSNSSQDSRNSLQRTINQSSYDQFMKLAKDTWGISLRVDPATASSIKTFAAPRPLPGVIFAGTGPGDSALVRKGIAISREVPLHIYAIGEQTGNTMADYGWLINRQTRQLVWEMKPGNSRPAGGSDLNVCYRGDVRLEPGEYDLFFATDDSHSRADWRRSPPADPFNYGVQLAVANENGRSAVKIIPPDDLSRNVIARLSGSAPDSQQSIGFSLPRKMPVQIYALGESVSRSRPADYGWLVDARTRERIWDMSRRPLRHAGGASKNQLVDERLDLPAGKYILYYQTDDSHHPGDWNTDQPFDPDHWGITVRSLDPGFKASDIKTFEGIAEQSPILVKITGAGDNQHIRKPFHIKQNTRLRIYALGEGSGGGMHDYGWIESAGNRRTVWKMTYPKTVHAGGADKNRLVDQVISIEAGDYILHYQTDDSHSYEDWNSPAPPDGKSWGISLYPADNVPAPVEAAAEAKPAEASPRPVKRK